MSFLKSKFGKVLQWLSLLLLAVVFLYFAFSGVKWDDFIKGIESCNFWWILASMVVSVIAFVVRALRWRLAMLPLSDKITRMDAYRGVTVGYLVNFALPRAGEFARCGVIAATGKSSFESVLGSVVLERSWDMLSYIIILFAVLLIGNNTFGNFVSEQVWNPFVETFSFNVLWILAGVVLAGVIALVLIYRKREFLSKNKFFAKLFEIVAGLWSGLVSGVKMKGKSKFFLLTVLLWFCYWCMSYFTIQAFPQVGSLNWADAMFLMVVGSLGWIVPVQGGIGAYHFILSLALAHIYGLEQTTGVIFATISHESQALTMLLCGILSLVQITLIKKKNFKNR